MVLQQIMNPTLTGIALSTIANGVKVSDVPSDFDSSCGKSTETFSFEEFHFKR